MDGIAALRSCRRSARDDSSYLYNRRYKDGSLDANTNARSAQAPRAINPEEVSTATREPGFGDVVLQRPGRELP